MDDIMDRSNSATANRWADWAYGGGRPDPANVNIVSQPQGAAPVNKWEQQSQQRNNAISNIYNNAFVNQSTDEQAKRLGITPQQQNVMKEEAYKNLGYGGSSYIMPDGNFALSGNANPKMYETLGGGAHQGFFGMGANRNPRLGSIGSRVSRPMTSPALPTQGSIFGS